MENIGVNLAGYCSNIFIHAKSYTAEISADLRRVNNRTPHAKCHIVAL